MSAATSLKLRQNISRLGMNAQKIQCALIIVQTAVVMTILPVRAYCKLSTKLLRVAVPHVIQGRLTRERNYIVSNNRKRVHVNTEGYGMK